MAPGDSKAPISLVLRLRCVYPVKAANQQVMFGVLLKKFDTSSFGLLFFCFFFIIMFIEIQRKNLTTFALNLCQEEVSLKELLWSAVRRLEW